MTDNTATPALDLEPLALDAFRLPRAALVGAIGLALAVALFSASVGAAGLSPVGALKSIIDRLPLVALDSGLSARQEDILFQIRLPRTVLGLLVGGSLALAGSAYQGAFRNPLADPYLLGVSAGAGFGAVLALGFGLDVGWGPFAAVPTAAFIGAMVAVLTAATLARSAWASPATLLLAGVAVAALFSAAQTFSLQRLSETRAREVLSWLFGQLSTSGWSEILVLGPYLALCGTVLLLHRRHLDVLRVGDDEARSVGLDPAKARLVVIVAASLLTAAAVSVSGLIAFVGLVVPHAVRLVVGHSYRIIMPISAVVGASFLALVDVGARTVAAPAELPVGVLTAFIGAPFFALILRRNPAQAR